MLLAHLPPHLRKIDMKMLDAIVRMRREGITNANALEHNVKERYATSSLKIDNAGYVHLEIYMKTINSESVDQLTSAGARVEYVNSRFSRIVCYLSFDVIEEMSHNDNIRCFVCVQEPILSVRSYTSVGDSILEADLARTSFNVTGQNTKLGVISDGVNHWTSSRDAGDLQGISMFFMTHALEMRGRHCPK